MKRQRYLATGLERALMGYANLPSKGGRRPLTPPISVLALPKKRTGWGKLSLAYRIPRCDTVVSGIVRTDCVRVRSCQHEMQRNQRSVCVCVCGVCGGVLVSIIALLF